MSLNCQGLGNRQKRRDVFHYLKQKDYSIYCLQDTHFENKMEKYVNSEWGYKAFFASFRSNSRGVAILFNNNFEFQIKRVKRDTNGNYIIIHFCAMEKEFVLVNVYGPNKDNPQFYKELSELIKNNGNQNIIAVGDWNLVMDPNLDYDNYKHVNNPKAKIAVEKMMSDLELNDVWRESNLECRRFTWRKNSPLQQSRLDFFLLSDYLYWYLEDTDILPGYRSDHSIITLHLSFGTSTKTNTFWKFNCSLLKDIKYVEDVKSEIENVIKEYSVGNENEAKDSTLNFETEFSISDKLFLDFLLMKIRTKTISYATFKKKNRKEREDRLVHEIDLIERKTNKTDRDIQILKQKNEELVSLRSKVMEGVMLRSRARWIAEGEKITKYFCSLEKRNYINKRMTKLVKNDGETIRDTEEISNEVNRFYTQLYRNKKDIKECEISDLVQEMPQLSLEESNSLEGEITLEEAGYALKQMQNGKSPGSDGFGAEFFKFFWKQIGPFVVRALNEAYRDGELSTTQKEGVITCIPKEDKPKEFVKNWRPISLLNVIYKIGSSCIANRIKAVLPKLVHEDQTGFIANRYMGDNIRLIYDLMHYLDTQQLPGMLLCLDFEKAFDTVDWGFMFKVLRAYGFGRDICQWIETLYKNIKSTVIVNGKPTHWFSVERGCRQGDPISPYIFILVVEIMALMIREDTDIKGVCINHVEHKILQFADDTQLMNNGDKASFEKSINIVNKFGEVSGLYLNTGKTQAVWLGSKKYSKEQYMPELNLNWNPKYFKVLGIWLGRDLKEIELKNYSEKMSQVQILFKIWAKRSITPLGRIAILKSLILSKLTHLWLLLPNPPDDFVSNIQQLCYKFVWNNKQDRINRRTVVRNVQCGGMGIPDIKQYMSALKLTWIRKFEKTNHKWKNICNTMYPFMSTLNQYGIRIFLTTKSNRFWNHVFKAFTHFSEKVEPKTSSELLAEPVLFNNNVLVGGSVLINRSWIRKGIHCIGHFFDGNGVFIKYADFKTKYNLQIDFVTFIGCINSLRNFIKKFNIQIKDNNYEYTTVALRSLYSVHKGARQYYDILMSDHMVPKCCTKWTEKLNTEIIWKNVFYKLQKIKDIKLRWFQMRIVHRIIATNIVLKEMGVASNDRCNFCRQERDSIEHFLWRCVYVNKFWVDLEKIFNERCHIATHINFNEHIVIFGVDPGIQTDDTTDLIILLAKFFIFKCKISSTIPIIDQFLRELKNRYIVEEHNAKITSKSFKFDNDWRLYLSIFDAPI